MTVDHDVARIRYLINKYGGDDVVQQCCVKEVWNVLGVTVCFVRYNYIHTIFLVY
jgi:hypothetical protein